MSKTFQFIPASIAVSALAASLTLVACGPQNGQPVAPAPTTAAATPLTVAPAAAVQPVPPTNGLQPLPANDARPAVVQPAPVAQPTPQATQAQAPSHPHTHTASATPARLGPVASASAGEIRGIEAIRTRPQGSGVGAVIGGVVGGLVGNQFGGGTGRTAATAVGVVGGAVAGNNLERNHNEGVSGYRINVRLDNGQSRTFEERRLDGLKVGDRVRVEGGQVRPA